MPRLSTLADRLNHLFDVHRHPEETTVDTKTGRVVKRQWYNHEVAAWCTQNGTPLSYEAVRGLRNGRAGNPKISTIQAIAAFFSVQPGFLLDEADTDLDRALRLAMADAGVRTVALNASKLPPAAKETLIALAKHLQKQQKTRNKD